MFDSADFDAHEAVHHFHDAPSGMRAIIAVHSTHRGPGAGGCRYWTYADPAAALTDALRLSRGMSYKNAMAGLPMGGGKAVLLGPAQKTPAMLDAFARAVESLGGRYVTAQDVGMSLDDLRRVGQGTRYVSGIPNEADPAGEGSGAPTADGVFAGLEAAVPRVLGRAGLEGVRIGIQGVGSVGARLARMLAAAGARLTLADVNRPVVEALGQELRADIADPVDIHAADLDVLAPCALGATLNPRTIPEIRAKLVAGAANNQLETPADGAALHARGITWVPDYVINAGGIILVAAQYLGETDPAKIATQVAAIGPRVGEVLDRAAAENVPPGEIADRMARALIGR